MHMYAMYCLCHAHAVAVSSPVGAEGAGWEARAWQLQTWVGPPLQASGPGLCTRHPPLQQNPNKHIDRRVVQRSIGMQ